MGAKSVNLIRGALQGLRERRKEPRTARRSTDDPVEQGPTRSTARWPKGHPNRRAQARRGGKASAAMVVEGDHGSLDEQGRNSARRPRWTRQGTYALLPGLVEPTLAKSPEVESPRNSPLSPTRAAIRLTRGARNERCPSSAALTGRKSAGDGGHNPSSRRAGCEQHKSGSVRGAPW